MYEEIFIYEGQMNEYTYYGEHNYTNQDCEALCNARDDCTAFDAPLLFIPGETAFCILRTRFAFEGEQRLPIEYINEFGVLTFQISTGSSDSMGMCWIKELCPEPIVIDLADLPTEPTIISPEGVPITFEPEEVYYVVDERLENPRDICYEPNAGICVPMAGSLEDRYHYIYEMNKGVEAFEGGATSYVSSSVLRDKK